LLDELVGKQGVVAAREHEAGEVPHNRSSLDVQVAEHSVRLPAANQLDDVGVHLGVQRARRQRHKFLQRSNFSDIFLTNKPLEGEPRKDLLLGINQAHFKQVERSRSCDERILQKDAAGEADRVLRVFLGSINLKLGIYIPISVELEEERKEAKTTKNLSSEAQKKTKQGNDEREEIDMLNNFVPTEGDLEEDDLYSIRQQVPLTISDLGDSSHMRMLYARQQEIQAQLMQYRQRRTASPPLSSSFTVNTFQGIPKGFSQSQGAIITPHAPFANRYGKR